MTKATAASVDAGGLFAAIDANDATAFVGFLTDDAVFRFGSAPAVHGRDDIHAAVDGFFATIAGCAHDVHKSIRSGSTVICEGEVTYQRLSGSKITLPFTDVLEYDGDLIAHYKIYMDVNPLYAE
jgi:limonene-1,2-epoxide hydrolase